jgi:hypothetical protein
MPAPTPAVTPHAPAGIKMEEGHPTIVTISANTTVSFWEVSVKPPGIDGGDAIDTSTMQNLAWRTFAARVLKTLTEASVTAQYNVAGIQQILAITNQPATVTIHFPGGAKMAFYGYLRTWDPADINEGDPPTSTIAIQPTNRDPVDGSEQAPVFVIPVSAARPSMSKRGKGTHKSSTGSPRKVRRVTHHTEPARGTPETKPSRRVEREEKVSPHTAAKHG